MRIRKKRWAQPELDKCPYFIPKADIYKGKWHEVFPCPDHPVYMELGCGKGMFVSQAALKYPGINWLALDIKNDMLGVARRTVEKFFTEADRSPENIRLVSTNISLLSNAFSAEDIIDRIYINFCNPWPRPKHHKRRLTHPRQLAQYRTILRDGGEIRFKTDDDELFEQSVPYFEENGFDITYITRDLHSDDSVENFVTEHEKMFTDEGKAIKYLTAVKRPQ